MSKKKGKKKRFDSNERTVFLLGLGIMALGILSIGIAIFRAKQIENSIDYKVVQASVEYAETKQSDLSASDRRQLAAMEEDLGRNLSSNEINYYFERDTYYKAKVTADVDGHKVKGNYYSDSLVSKGDTVSVVVYQTKGGKYKMIDPLKYSFGNYIVTGALAVIIGLGLCLMCLLSSSMTKSGKKKKQ